MTSSFERVKGVMSAKLFGPLLCLLDVNDRVDVVELFRIWS